MEKTFITYGHVLTNDKFLTPHNGRRRFINKPDGGLWASPIDANFGWKEWCEDESFPCNFNTWTKFKLKDESRIFTIDNYLDFQRLMNKYNTVGDYGRFLDWEKIIKDYDAVYLTDNGNRECHLPIGISGLSVFGLEDLNSWDVESILILDFNIVDILESK